MTGSIPRSTLSRFRQIAILEGVSFLLLMFVAMPVKYIAGNGILVKYFGWAHGVLFILYCIWLLRVWIEYRWGLVKVVLAFIASLVPFGTFVLEHKLKKEELA